MENIMSTILQSIRLRVISYVYRLFPDKLYLKIQYKKRIGKRLNLKSPVSFNEKIQWLKLYDRNPEYVKLVDKHLVKEIIKNRLGAEYIIPTIGVWNSVEDIDFYGLPNQFVLKCTHDSGGIVICKNKTEFDFEKAKKSLNRTMKRDYFYHGREWPYKNVERKIIAEKYMVDESGYELKDYKLMCFNGKVRCSFTCSNRSSQNGLYVNFYDGNWNPMPFERHYPKNPNEIPKPQSYDKMVEIAEVLSKDIPFVRVDFYQIEGQPVVGELTFYPGSGFEEFTPDIWDKKLGEWMVLPINKVE